ncbi:unnamed protein product [Mytilus coruscus]|uniref:B box-type domain-containing protein n=1 Tax=Mytilus coruscus TaxID=42192 RepID=A0A6J8AXB8_MYTCO|nr:unnamed protein product [Mytilus coruscus]
MILTGTLRMGEIINQCEICFLGGELKTSIKYCLDCRQPLCEGCHQQHGKFRLLNDHKVLSIEEYSKFLPEIRNFKKTCTDHEDETFEFLCFDHNCCVCFLCLKDKHKLCKGVHKVKSLNADEHVELFFSKLNSNKKKAERLVNVYQSNISDLRKVTQSAKSDIQSIINNVQSHLCRFRSTIERQLADETVKLKQKIKYCEEIVAKIAKRKEVLQKFLKYGDSYQVFGKLCALETEQKNDEKLLLDMESKLHKVTFRFTIVPPITDQIVRLTVS